jgi:hypothetical protein
MGEILVSERASRLPPAIAGNGGSDFVVVWNNLNGAGVSGRVIQASAGAAGGEQFPVNTTARGEHRAPAVAMMGGSHPGFVVVWGVADASGHDVLLQRFAPDGRKIGEEIRVNATSVDTDFRPAVCRLPDLNFVVSWVSSNRDEGIRAQIFKPNGARVGSEFRVNTSEGFHIGGIAIAPLENGSFAVAWRGGSNLADAKGTPRLQIFNLDGSKAGSEIVPNFVAFNGEMAMTFINTAEIGAEPGRFVIAHTSSAGGGDERLVDASLFGPDGDRRVTFSVTHRDDHSVGTQPAASGQPDRRFVIAWTDEKVSVGGGTGRNIKAMLFSADRGALMPAISVSTSDVGDQSCPCVATIMNQLGEVTAFAWIDDSVSGAGSSSRAVKARIFSHFTPE